MDRFDAIFANRYVDVVEPWQSTESTRHRTRAWKVAFQAAEHKDRRLIIQHLLLGMNAHINLDLGVAAAEVAPGAELRKLKTDFNLINDVLSGMLDAVQKAIGKHSPMMHVLDQLGGPLGDQILGFSFPVIRQTAWMDAIVLAHQSGAEKEHTINVIDCRTVLSALPILDPGGVAGKAVESTVLLSETRDVVPVIDTLNSVVPSKAPSDEPEKPDKPGFLDPNQLRFF